MVSLLKTFCVLVFFFSFYFFSATLHWATWAWSRWKDCSGGKVSKQQEDRERENWKNHAESEAAQRQCLLNWSTDHQKAFLSLWLSPRDQGIRHIQLRKTSNHHPSWRAKQALGAERKRKKELETRTKRGSSTDESQSRGAERDAQKDQIVKREVNRVTGLLQVCPQRVLKESDTPESP